MKTFQLLIVSPDATNSQAITSALEQKRFEITVVDSDETAIEQLCQKAFNVVIAGKELNDVAVGKLKAVFNRLSKETPVIRQKANDPGALITAIKKAYDAEQRKSLQHIRVKDTLDVNNLAESIRLVP